MAFVSRGFLGRRRGGTHGGRLPPGQYDVGDGFPVLSAGPTPRTPVSDWTFSIEVAGQPVQAWTWDEFGELPRDEITRDIHCVTKWSKFDTRWSGISLDTLLADLITPALTHVLAFSDGDYTTNLPLADATGGKAWVVDRFDGEPLDPEHGGPARLLVPHLYFWKSAKWVRGLRLLTHDEPGFWETLGYHNRGDPWLEQRYRGD